MDNPELYQESNSLQKRDVIRCLHEYSGRIRWRGHARVVDLGCGDGATTASVLRARLPSDFVQLVGCDVSARMVRHAQAHYADARTTFRQLDLAAPLPSDMKGSFDHAFSFFAIHWILDQEHVFSNIYELLAPGGDCLLLFVAKCHLVDTFRALAAQSAWRTRLTLPSLRIFAYNDSHNPETEVRQTMEKVGFKNILVVRKVTKYTFETLDDYKGHLLSLSPFDIPDELREEYTRAHLQAVLDLDLPGYQLERGEHDKPSEGRLHKEYSIIIASACK